MQFFVMSSVIALLAATSAFGAPNIPTPAESDESRIAARDAVEKHLGKRVDCLYKDQPNPCIACYQQPQNGAISSGGPGQALGT